MKRVLIVSLCAVALGLGSPTLASANSDEVGMGMIADVVIARPACLVATAVGSVAFVLALPFSLPSKSVKHTAHALVVVPAKATFTRPVGDFDTLGHY
jgi:hypothetical protein